MPLNELPTCRCTKKKPICRSCYKETLSRLHMLCTVCLQMDSSFLEQKRYERIQQEELVEHGSLSNTYTMKILNRMVGRESWIGRLFSYYLGSTRVIHIRDHDSVRDVSVARLGPNPSRNSVVSPVIRSDTTIAFVSIISYIILSILITIAIILPCLCISYFEKLTTEALKEAYNKFQTLLISISIFICDFRILD